MKTKNILITALIVIIVLIGIVWSQKNDQKISTKDHINVSIGPEPSTIDPGKNIDAYGAIYIHHMFEGLAKLDDNDQLIPGMAEKWEMSDDGLTMRNTLLK